MVALVFTICMVFAFNERNVTEGVENKPGMCDVVGRGLCDAEEKCGKVGDPPGYCAVVRSVQGTAYEMKRSEPARTGGTTSQLLDRVNEMWTQATDDTGKLCIPECGFEETLKLTMNDLKTQCTAVNDLMEQYNLLDDNGDLSECAETALNKCKRVDGDSSAS